jgi:hypothetical protein
MVGGLRGFIREGTETFTTGDSEDTEDDTEDF